MRALRSLLAAAAVSAGCVTIPHPTPVDVERARGSWPEASLQTLEEGRSLYTSRCSGCHALYGPGRHTPQQWSKAIHEMAARAKLRPDEVDLILQFLATVSAQPS